MKRERERHVTLPATIPTKSCSLERTVVPITIGVDLTANTYEPAAMATKKATMKGGRAMLRERERERRREREREREGR